MYKFLTIALISFMLPLSAFAQDGGPDAFSPDAGASDAGALMDAAVDAASASPVVTVPEVDAEFVQSMIEAAKGGQWSIFVSLVIMLLVWGATKAPFLSKFIKGKAKIWTAAVAGLLAAFATALFIDASDGNDAIDWLRVASQGLSAGLAAGGLWSLLGRRIMGEPIDADGDGVLDPKTPEA